VAAGAAQAGEETRVKEGLGVEQWHSDVDPTYGVSLAAFYREQLVASSSHVGKAIDELPAWRPDRRPRSAG